MKKILFVLQTLSVILVQIQQANSEFVPLKGYKNSDTEVIPSSKESTSSSDGVVSIYTESEACPLHCQNGAICVKRQVLAMDDDRNEAPGIIATNHNEWECVCPEGLAGMFCEEEMRRLDTTNCGNLVCQNKGTCARGHNYAVDGAVCDCSKSIQFNHNAPPPFNFKRWVGRTCEIEVQKTDYCEGTREHLFCVNGGTCRTNQENFLDRPCRCPPGYKGRFCEYSVEHVRSDCTLTCNGQGSCQHGINPFSNSGANQPLGLPNAGSSDFMHCNCNRGYAGINCDYEYIKCGSTNSRYCYHGTTCANGTNTCDCGNDKSETKRTGDFCQFEATDDCSSPITIDPESAVDILDLSYKMTAEDIPFCVNNGVCYSVADTDFYCLCGSNEFGFWTGQRCEIRDVAFHETVAPTVVQTWPPVFDVGGPAPSAPVRKDPEPTTWGNFTLCGGLACRNGGECAHGHNYEALGAVCDCSKAIRFEDGILKQYVGKTCEIEVRDEDFCPGDVLFCINGGTCRVKAKNFGDQPCMCTDEFTGRHCEYKVSDVQDRCKLTCSGSGKCQHGFNPELETGPNGLLDLPSRGSSNFMHCVCDDGHAGINCEYDVVKCGGRNRYCFHGSSCIEIEKDVDFDDLKSTEVCECTNPQGKKLAGDYCEFTATDLCEDPIEIDDFTASKTFDRFFKMTTDDDPYCVNDGRCFRVKQLGDTYYCSCDPSSWTGKRCEIEIVPPYETPSPTPAWTETMPPAIEAYVTDFPSPDYDSPDRDDSQFSKSAQEEDGMSGGGKFGVVLLTFFGVGCLTAVFLYFRKRASWVRDITYRENECVTEGSLYKDRDVDMESYEEHVFQNTHVSSTSDDSGTTDVQNRQSPDYPEEPKSQFV